MVFIPIINITNVCYQGIYLYPSIIHTDHTYQYARMSVAAEVVTSVSDQHENFLIAAVPCISHLAVVHYKLSYTNLSSVSNPFKNFLIATLLNLSSISHEKLSYTNLHCSVKFHYT
jgi:hypothetical protein